jgi:peptide/nickel transport system substrate-binding protein
MDTRTAPFDDVNVRLALKHAINREEMVSKILQGYGSIGNDHPIGRGQRFFANDLEQRTYDPDKARFHMKEAGVDSLNVTLKAADAAFAGAIDAAVLFSESAREAGIDLKVERVPNDGYWSNVWMTEPFCACYWSGRPTSDWMFTTAYKGGVNWNDAYWKNDKFDTMLIEARSELDEAKRREMYADMQGIVKDDGGTIIPMFAQYVFAMSDKVTHGDMASNWALDGERWAERWWFA